MNEREKENESKAKIGSEKNRKVERETVEQHLPILIFNPQSLTDYTR